MVKSAYIHIPFCEKICSYCDFCKMFYNEELVNKYLEELSLEIDNSYNNELLDTIYIGGGTPSSLNIKQLNKLLDITNKFKLNDNYEFTIECNFENITHEKLDLFKKTGINRLSFGLESINKNNLEILDRTISKEKVIDTINYCHKIGLHNINIDIMYAIKNETLEILQEDINFIKTLDITHISTYSLIIEKNTKLYIKKCDYIDEDLDRKMYDLICHELKDFDHYEISNFAKKKEYRSKHNQAYWKNLEYYGFGLGSSGYEGNVRYEKTRSINKYLNHDYIKDNGIEFLTNKDKIYYEIILNLRTKEGINLIEFKNKYKNNLEYYYNYKDLLYKNYLVKKNNHIFIPENLYYTSNTIIIQLLEGEKDE